jgi:radical SAM protein with 4Fe4S-binding SPASM domain
MRAHAANTRLNEFEYRQGRIALHSWPRVIDLGLTLKCNLRCEMCFSRRLEMIDLDPECLEKVTPYLDSCHRIVWNDAGELFASSRTPEFVALMKRFRPPESYVSTNGLLLDRYVDDLLDSGLTELSISVDAVRAETYEWIRRGARWDRLIANLELLQRKKAERQSPWPRVTFVFVAMRRNLAELPEFPEFARRYGGEAVHVLKMMPTPSGLERTEAPAFEEERAAYLEALRRARAVGIEIQHTFLNNDVLLPPAAAAVEPHEHRPPSGSRSVPLERLHRRQFEPTSGTVPLCAAPWKEFLIQTDGRVRACCFSPAVMGDLHEATLPEIWNGAEYQRFRRRLATYDFSTCQGCPYLAKVIAVSDDPLETALIDTEQQMAEQGRWIEAYANDVTQFLDYARRVRRGQWQAAWREFGAAFRAAARILKKHFFVKPALARTVTAQRRINLQLLGAARLARQQARRMREDAEILIEAARWQQDGRSQSAAQPSAAPAALRALEVDPAQDPIDALFYSARFVRHETPARLKAGATVKVPLAIMNTSAVQWPTAGDEAVKISYSWHRANGAIQQRDGLRTSLDRSPNPGETIDLLAALKAPDQPGDYILKWDLVYDPFAWFKDRGAPPLEIEVVVEF